MNIFNVQDLYIDENEILRLLGYKNTTPDEEILDSVREEIKQCKSYIYPLVYFEKIKINKLEENTVTLENGIILEGEFIYSKLKNCSYIIAQVSTIGEEIDKIIKEAFDSGDYLKGMIVDSIGTVAVGYTDKTFWNKNVDEIKDSNIGITSRLSPGDTSWELKEQKKIFQCLGEENFDVILSDSFLICPIKSTSAVYGFGENIGITRIEHICSECSMKHCSYRADSKIELVINKKDTKEIIDIIKGSNLLQELRNNKFFIDNSCGGNGTCGKCKVKIIKGVKSPSDLDKKHLTVSELEMGVRLSCNITIDEELEIELEDGTDSMKVLVNSDSKVYAVNSPIVKTHCIMKEPSIEDQRDDLQRLMDACGISDLHLGIEDLSGLSDIIRSSGFNLTTTTIGHTLLHIEAGDSSTKSYGIAFDVGTTTIAAYLMNLKNGKAIDVVSQVNKQRNYGADVISRINYSIENKDGLSTLKNHIVTQLNNMIEILFNKNNINENNIYDIAIVGNTTMLHLLLGLPCKNIALAPYIPTTTKTLQFRAKELGMITKGIVSILPGVASYVGSDITAGILSCEILKSEKFSILLDLGTNGEIVLGNKNGVVTCSTAAGPAFEGANIKYGIGGVRGAISKIDLSKEKIYETIGNEVAIGICGSGVLDVVAQLLKYGVIDETGRMVDEDEIDNEVIKNKLVEIDKMRQFIIVEASDNSEMISFTQKDVREVQLAKAAVCAGIKILIKEKGIHYDDIENIYIGGGFGNYMDIESSLAIGMIPEELRGKIKSIGNCAGNGAKMYLLSDEVRKETADIISKTEYIELSKMSDFQDYFVDSMMME